MGVSQLMGKKINNQILGYIFRQTQYEDCLPEMLVLGEQKDKDHKDVSSQKTRR